MHNTYHMHKYVTLLISILVVASIQAQINVNPSEFEKYPVFPGCETVAVAEIPNCFNSKLIQFFIEKFEMPSRVNEEQYQGQMVMLFEVTTKGELKLLNTCLLYTSPSPRDLSTSRMPSSA